MNPKRSSPFIPVVALATVASTVMILAVTRRRRRQPASETSTTASAYEELIGRTPLVKLERLSNLIGRNIHVKMESFNPGGTGKDRAALSMLIQAEESGQLPLPNTASRKATTTSTSVNGDSTMSSSTSVDGDSTMSSSTSVDGDSTMSSSDSINQSIHEAMRRSKTGGLVVEGTSGSTGISLATLCAARGHACLMVLPDDQAFEKQAILTTLGAVVHIVPNSAISNPQHYVNMARRIADIACTQFAIPAIFINQFENEANFHVHYTTTGPEIYKQCPHLNAFVMSSGTGGTIAGVAKYLQSRNASCQIVLVDPPGSALYHRIHHGVAYAPQQQERALKRHRYDTLAEGIGLDRLTRNFLLGVDCIDDAIRVSDQEAVDMAHWLLRNEGLWVGSSSAMNVAAAVQVASSLDAGSTVVTVICDTGSRHVTRFWNANFIREWGLKWPGDSSGECIPECLRDYYKQK